MCSAWLRVVGGPTPTVGTHLVWFDLSSMVSVCHIEESIAYDMQKGETSAINPLQGAIPRSLLRERAVSGSFRYPVACCGEVSFLTPRLSYATPRASVKSSGRAVLAPSPGGRGLG
jgi:hypothetical protein